MDKFTKSAEDYLKYIYYIESEHKKVTTSSLAKVLQVSPASVSEMIVKLSNKGWIKNTPYYGFKLTTKGKKAAINLIRKHRLLEVFLMQHLNYPWDEIHQDAEILEHFCSDNFIKRLEKYLGYPKFDPHGYPIPDSKGRIKEVKSINLGSAETGGKYIISKVNDIDEDILKYISNIGVRLNSKITLKDKLEFDKSLIIVLNGKNHLITKKIADNIFVEEL